MAPASLLLGLTIEKVLPENPHDRPEMLETDMNAAIGSGQDDEQIREMRWTMPHRGGCHMLEGMRDITMDDDDVDYDGDDNADFTDSSDDGDGMMLMMMTMTTMTMMMMDNPGGC